MAQSKVGIFNLALSSIGTRARVALPTEASREAEICLRWYDVIQDTVLRAANWASARKTKRLALVAERNFSLDWADGDPEPPWCFTYSQPEDMLQPRFLERFQQFQLGMRNGTKVLFTNSENALLTYTMRQEDISVWDANLYQSVAMGLAAAVALPLHGKASRAKFALEEANRIIIEARVQSANASMAQFDHVPDWLAARGVSSGMQPSGFIFPNGPLLALSTWADTVP